MRPLKDGKSVAVENGALSDVSKRVIAGILDVAPALCAFGNTIPTSYLRLVPHQEAPTNVCWGERNRSALIRVPLGWVGTGDMVAKENPLEQPQSRDYSGKQTFELRSPDGSADIYLLIAGICAGARHGLEMPDALEFAQRTFVDVNIFDSKYTSKQDNLPQLPYSCKAASEALLQKADVFKKYDVFTDQLINGIAHQLESFDDENLREKISGSNEETINVVKRFIHCG
jgi:glutamine synthetase